jgi:hypothetical protein
MIFLSLPSKCWDYRPEPSHPAPTLVFKLLIRILPFSGNHTLPLLHTRTHTHNARTHAHAHTRTRTRMHAHTRTRTHTRTHTRAHTHAHARTHARTVNRKAPGAAAELQVRPSSPLKMRKAVLGSSSNQCSLFLFACKGTGDRVSVPRSKM